MNSQPQMPTLMPLTPVVKKLMIVNVAIWFFLQVVLEGFILPEKWITLYGSLIPIATFDKFFVWQPFTYMFLHGREVTHILFNMLMLWMTGSELESRWGSRFFLVYYLVAGVGAAILYLMIVIGYGLITGEPKGWMSPVVGASGAIFGLLVAYGILFGERIVHFMMIFPMKAKHFVWILCAILGVTLLNDGLVGGDVAHLAHLGGIVSGYLFLKVWSHWEKGRAFNSGGGKRARRADGRRNLRLVVNNDTKKADASSGPKYWN